MVLATWGTHICQNYDHPIQQVDCEWSSAIPVEKGVYQTCTKRGQSYKLFWLSANFNHAGNVTDDGEDGGKMMKMMVSIAHLSTQPADIWRSVCVQTSRIYPCRPHSYAANNFKLINHEWIRHRYRARFSKAFDTVKHSKIAEKLSYLDLPPNVYNWVIDFLTGHTHCTKFWTHTRVGQRKQSIIVEVKIPRNHIQEAPFTWYHRRPYHPRHSTCELSENHRGHTEQQLLDVRARLISHQFICPVIIRAPHSKIAWIRRPVTADSVPGYSHLEAPIFLLSMVGVHKRRPTWPTGIIPSEGCQSRLPQKQFANTECYMRGSRWQALPQDHNESMSSTPPTSATKKCPFIRSATSGRIVKRWGGGLSKVFYQ